MGLLFSDQDVYPDGYWLNRPDHPLSNTQEKINLSEYRYFNDESLFGVGSMTLRELLKHIELLSEEDMDLEVRIFMGVGENSPTATLVGINIDLVRNADVTPGAQCIETSLYGQHECHARRCVLIMRGS